MTRYLHGRITPNQMRAWSEKDRAAAVEWARANGLDECVVSANRCVSIVSEGKDIADAQVEFFEHVLGPTGCLQIDPATDEVVQFERSVPLVTPMPLGFIAWRWHPNPVPENAVSDAVSA